ncbi:MAG: exonuclease SbcCD subunit D [Clostridiales bacterium]|nr:exonuclease SbcCD subunit D [Clostridiales bacterium]
MKFLHLADLHLGKRVNEFSMINEQKHILNQIIEVALDLGIDTIIIAGDVYDKTIPNNDAVILLDNFLTKLTSEGISVIMISGNHDSSERLNFGSRLMKKNKVYINSIFDGKMNKVVFNDGYGALNIYTLPFVKPALIATFYPDFKITTYDKAIKVIMENTEINTSERNMLVAHQFVTSGSESPERSESESISVGGIDNVDASSFDKFDYVALGHLHKNQKIGRETIRYSGSPLKYSISEVNHKKSITFIDMKEKGKTILKNIPLMPINDLREIRGPIASLVDENIARLNNTNDYIHAILTDEEQIYDAIGQLRSVYPNTMKISFDNSKTKINETFSGLSMDLNTKSDLELFQEFYAIQNNREMSDKQIEFISKLLSD